MRRCPHSGFSLARRTTRRAMPGLVGGRPDLRRLLMLYFFAASLRCQASSVVGVTGKTSAQRLRGTSRASAANQARSADSYRTRPACRRSTAFSCRSTSSSASFARSLRNTRTARPSTRHVSKYTILSSTRQANQHHVKPAGGSAGQSLNRVFERYSLRWRAGFLRAGEYSALGPMVLVAERNRLSEFLQNACNRTNIYGLRLPRPRPQLRADDPVLAPPQRPNDATSSRPDHGRSFVFQGT